MIKLLDLFEYPFLVGGIFLSLSDIHEVLAIILLIVDSIWLLAKLIIKIIKYSKDGELSDDEIEDLENDLNNKEKKD